MIDALGKAITVPSGAVKAYKGLGFNVVDERVEESTQIPEEFEGEEEAPELTEEQAFIVEMEKKPLAQWNKEEVKKYASIAGVDISGTKNAQEAKERIKAYIDMKSEIGKDDE